MKNSKINVSIIIVNYNLTESVKVLLSSIKEHVSGINYEVIVVDNNSDDRSIETLAELFPDFNFIYSERNLGFGQGNNIGFNKSSGEYLLLLNPDTYLISNLPYGLYKFAEENPHYGIIGPKMIFPNGMYQFSTAKFPSIFQEIGNLSGLSIPIRKIFNILQFNIFNRNVLEVDYIFGSCMMINSNLYKELNGFDNDYFLFDEDMDFCYRTWYKSKYRVIYYLGEKIVHVKSQVTGKDMAKRIRLIYESRLKFIYKNYSVVKKYIVKFSVIGMFSLKYLYVFLKKNSQKTFKKSYRDIISLYLRNFFT